MTQRVWSSYYELLPSNKQKNIDWIYIDCIVLYKSMIRFRKKRDIITKGQMIIGKSASTILFYLGSPKIRFILILKKVILLSMTVQQWFHRIYHEFMFLGDPKDHASSFKVVFYTENISTLSYADFWDFFN